MRFKQYLQTEAMSFSLFRKHSKGWKPKPEYFRIFSKYNTGMRKDKKPYRIYFDLKESDNNLPTKSVVILADINDIINSNESYIVEDYIKGIAIHYNSKQRMKIGKLLTKIIKNTENDYFKKIYKDILNRFNEDPARQSTKNTYMVVISHHPYDVAGMSYDRGWTSCMDLSGGSNREYVASDIKEGTIIAYVINPSDTNINKPTARILIKPFISVSNKKDILFVPEETVYGTPPSGFTKLVDSWCEEVNKGKLVDIYELPDNLYQDNISKLKINLPKEVQDVVSKNPKVIDTYSEHLQKSFVILEPDNIEFIKNPSEDVQLVAVSKDGYSIGYINNPTEKVQLVAVSKSGWIIDNIKNPSEDVQLAAVRRNDSSIEYIKNPTEKVQLAAVRKDKSLIKYIKNPTEKVQLAVVRKDESSIKHIKNLTEKVQLMVANKRGLEFIIQYHKKN